MMQNHFFLLGMTLLFLSTSCIEPKQKDSEAKRVAYQEPSSNSDKSVTARRLMSLNQWAIELLKSTQEIDDFQKMADNYFMKRSIQGAEPLSIYTLSLRPGEECFRETIGYSLWWNGHRDQIKRQIDSAAQFIFEFHKAVNGKSYGPFQVTEVEICPEKIVGRKMTFMNHKLTIGVPFSLTGQYKPISSDELLASWHSADHLGSKPNLYNNIFTRKKLQKLWMIFDPIGHVRTTLRSLFEEQASGFVQRIKNLGAVNNLDLLGESLLSQVLDKSRLKIGNDDRLKELDKKGQLPKLIANWICILNNRALANDLSLSSISAFDRVVRGSNNKINIDIRAGLVAVGNYHQIGVSFAFDGAPYQGYINTEVLESKTDLNATVYGGLVSVFTVDDVDVDAALKLMIKSSEKSLATVAFDRAVQHTLQGETLCQ